MLGALILSILPSGTLLAPVSLRPASTGLLRDTTAVEKILEFALSLEKEGDPYRAITEYKRADFQASELADRRKARLGIARCYHAGARWEALEAAAGRALQLTGWTARQHIELTVARALALWNLGRALEASALLETLPDVNLEDAERILKAWVTLAAGDLPRATDQFAALQHGSAVSVLQAWPTTPYSRALAGTLSAVIPGAGQLYSGKNQAALGAFFVNGLLLGGTLEAFNQDHEVLGWGLGVVTLGFWSGNIYGAVNFAHQENREIFQERDIYLARKLSLDDNFRDTFHWQFSLPF